ncbi:uncharacterized protein LOC123918370 isoform X1 [Trifolium pratense]|uniref:uncharacterized protein LOC123918370 isoform X1 n=1 Tax=Trifolium pratense TaxID=57577 RepID=UPI001E697229|nr:uncharacterized protein LOC123918370 isoform X1 [Trifolium pratense]
MVCKVQKRVSLRRRLHIMRFFNNSNNNQEYVKIEKIREGTFMVKVTCEKGGDKLVSILEAFEEICMNVEQASVSCENGFSMEAIIVAEDQNVDIRDVNQALLKAIGKQSGEKALEEIN